MRTGLLIIFALLLIIGAALAVYLGNKGAELSASADDDMRNAELEAQKLSYTTQLKAQEVEYKQKAAQIGYNNCVKKCCNWTGFFCPNKKECRKACDYQYQVNAGLISNVAKGRVVSWAGQISS